MSDLIESKVIDTYEEHIYHQSYHKDCSTCYKENRKLKAWEIVNRKNVAKRLGRPLTDNLRNSYGDNYPLGFRSE